MSKQHVGNYNELDCLRGIAQKLGGNAANRNELGALRVIVTQLGAIPEGRYISNMNEIQCLRAIVGSYTNPDLLGWELIAGEDGTSYMLRAEDEGYLIKPRHYYTNSLGVIAVDGPATGVIGPNLFVPEHQWWKLNDGSGTDIAAEVGQVGTTNAAWVTGKSGSGFALDFNGTSHRASTTATLDLSASQKITFTFWAKITSLAATQILFESSANVNNINSGVMVLADGGNLFGYVADPVNGSGANGKSMRSTTPPATGVWVFIAITFDHSVAVGDVKMWFGDGTTVTSQAMTLFSNGHTNTGNFSNDRIFVGARNEASLWADWELDDWRIHEGELSVGALTAIMNNPQ